MVKLHLWGDLLKFAARGFRKECVHHGRSGEREAHQVADRRPMRAGRAVEQRLEQEPQRAAGGSSDQSCTCRRCAV